MWRGLTAPQPSTPGGGVEGSKSGVNLVEPRWRMTAPDCARLGHAGSGAAGGKTRPDGGATYRAFTTSPATEGWVARGNASHGSKTIMALPLLAGILYNMSNMASRLC